MGAVEQAGPASATSGNARPRILVLLATYNGVQWLREQVDSILSQDDVEVEILVGDDASKDGTGDLLRHAWAEDSRVAFRIWERASGSAGANFRRLFREA